MVLVNGVTGVHSTERSVNGSNGSTTVCFDSAPTVAEVRRLLSLNGQNGLVSGSREQSLRTLLGLNGCIVEADLDSTADIKSYLHRESIDRINYFDSNDFLSSRLPDEDYISVLIDNQRKNIEDVGDDYKRLHMLKKAFRFNYDRYLDVFKDKLVRVARDIYKQALYNKLLSDPTDSAGYISEELAEEQNRPVRNFQSVNGTYKWAVDSLTEDRDAVVGIHRYLRDGDGQRKFVRDLINSQKLHHSNGDDSALEYITGWVGHSPQSLLKARVVLNELIEDIPIGPNRLTFHLNSLEDKIRDSSSRSIKGGWSWWNMLGILSRRNNSGGTEGGLNDLSGQPLSEFMVNIEDRIASLAKDVFEDEKRIIEEIKVKHRRHFLKVGSIWTGVGTVVSSLGAGTTYYLVNRANAIYFNDKVTSIEDRIRPYRSLVYETFLTQARSNLRAFPAERRDPLNINGYDTWVYQNSTVGTQQFRGGICRDYFRPLGLCLIPNLPQSPNMEGLPTYMIGNLSNCLRDLIPQDVWNNTISYIIGSSIVSRAPIPGSRMITFLDPYSAYSLVSGRNILQQAVSDEIRIRNIAGSVADSRGLQGQQREDFINSHLQPRDFVEIDQDYVNIGTALRILSDAVRKRKFEVLISGPLSNEQYQAVIADGIDTGNIARYTEPSEAVANIGRFKGYEVLSSLIRQFDEAKNNRDITRIEQLEPLIDELLRFNSSTYSPEKTRITMSHLALCEIILEKLNRAFDIRYQEIKNRNTYRARLINEEPMYSVLNR